MKMLPGLAALSAACLLVSARAAIADDWLPHPADARWQYQWTDTSYDQSGTTENVVVQKQAGSSFTLAWADSADQPPGAGNMGIQCQQNADIGEMTFLDSSSGLINTDWNSCPPPSSMPVLCAVASTCANSLSSTLYDVIWGNRVPVLSEPLLLGTTWNATGGVQNEVSSTSQYLGMRAIKVPAFPTGVIAAQVQTNVALGGTFGDDYGSGVRTTWWVRGVGPVLVVFDHVDGSVTTASLLSTNLHPSPILPDADYFPLHQGLTARYQMSNNKHLRRPEIEELSVDAVANRTARISIKSVSGPMRVAGVYLFSTRLDSVRNLSGSTSAATLLKFPRLGHNRHFFTPIDLMTFGFNPMLTAYPQADQTWSSGNPRDLGIYGVTGTTKVIGVRRVHVPAGTFDALEVQSDLTQKGYPFGSGVRTMWFAAGRGLLKLLFRHADGSASVVQLLR
jgi:hypothetical protein